jgi:hypothetical protein
MRFTLPLLRQVAISMCPLLYLECLVAELQAGIRIIDVLNLQGTVCCVQLISRSLVSPSKR